mmetsp:Transcript_23498/g.39800  ORF Transcript_23498/g.39800 Transcript_23498/m.39800 type:complete len:284 (-) Transcript_23498:389-1240(-)
MRTPVSRRSKWRTAERLRLFFFTSSAVGRLASSTATPTFFASCLKGTAGPPLLPPPPPLPFFALPPSSPSSSSLLSSSSKNVDALPPLLRCWFSSYHTRRGASDMATSKRREWSTTMAHSECFHVKIAVRPPSRSSFMDASSPAASSKYSLFTTIRSAWNVILAGCMAWYSFPFASTTRAANVEVRIPSPSSFPCRLARSTASAMRRAASGCSPPYRSMLVASSRRPARRRYCSAVSTSGRTSKRMSRGQSNSGRNPRRPSSCGLEMPMSMSTPCTNPSIKLV